VRKGLLIGVGTLGGLGAVLAITPPQFTNSTLSTTPTTPVDTQSAAPAPAATTAAPKATATKKAATKTTTKPKSATATKSATAKKTASSTTTSQGSTTATTPTPAATQSAQTTGGVSGTYVGATSQTRWGPVQVQITVSNGKITAAKALQYPNGDFRSSEISKQAIPYLVQETLQAQSSNIQGVGGASYTSYGWYQSLQSALAKAGMK
jgi:uncharacterized protein with FMN-binding domain